MPVPQDISVSHPIQSLDSVCPPAAEQKQAFLVQLTAILLRYHSSQSVNPQTKICVAAGNILRTFVRSIIETELSGAGL